jgi:hypothetical protein
MAHYVRTRIWSRLRCGLVVLCVGALSSALRPLAAHAIPLAGTIRYTGSQGQVSTERPIAIFLNTDGFFNGHERGSVAVTSNGGGFQFEVPAAGDYYLVYVFLASGDIQLGEPFEIYNGRFACPSDPVHVPPSGVTGLALEFDDIGIASGIAGRVTYTGNRGLVEESRPLSVLASTDPTFHQLPTCSLGAQSNDVGSNGGRFYLFTLDTNSYYLRPFVDLNGNGDLDAGEPFGTCSNSLEAGTDQTGVTITFGDDGVATCAVPSPPIPTPTVTPTSNAVVLSGTICYTGSRGPVSADHRILVFMCDGATLAEATSCIKARVTSNCGPFAFETPAAGNYYLLYGLEGVTRGDINIGSPFEIYNNRCNFPADPVAVPQSDVRLDFGDTCFLSGIAGNVSYKGNQGPVSQNRPLRVEAFADPGFSRGRLPWLGNTQDNDAGYDLPTWDGATYYLRTWFDLNNNGTLDIGEPFQIYDNKGAPPGDPVVASTTQTNINFTFGDENVSSACVGDCDGTAQVTIDEILTMVNIALSSLDVGACRAGDATQDGHITIDEILSAVNNALNGC